jgi:hypothetical protein
MKKLIRFAIFFALPILGFSQQSEGIDDTRGTIVILFGERTPDGQIDRKTVIPWKLGNKYGWDIYIESQEPEVIIETVLTLPGSATWTSDQAPDDGTIKSVEEEISDKNDQLRKKFTIDTSKPSLFRHTFEIIEGDPKGDHRGQVYLNDNLISDIKFKIQ